LKRSTATGASNVELGAACKEAHDVLVLNQMQSGIGRHIG